MAMYYGSLTFVVAALIFYQVIQKSTPADVNPVVSLFITYVVSGILCIIAFPYFRGNETILESLRKVNWTSFALGTTVFGVELGYLLAYRAGWNISTANLLSTTTVSLMLVPIGILALHERFTVTNALGAALCFIGLLLLKNR